jgi:hypothetical protein
MRYILVLLSLFAFCADAFSKIECLPKLDAFIGKYEIFRGQEFNSNFSKCLANDKSKIQFKGVPASGVPLDGFIVGIESFWHKKLQYVVKVTTKTGGHTTLVKLLAHKSGSDIFNPKFNWSFSSSMGYIVVSKSTASNIEVRTRDHHMGNDCRWVTEDLYHYLDTIFEKISTTEVLRECT